MSPPGLAFDAGRGALALAGVRDLFVTHGHLDHALGVPFVLSQRTLHQFAGTRVFCPRPVAADLEAFVAAAARLERVRYEAEFVPLDPGDRVDVGRGLAVEAFATDHVVPSLGFHLVRRRHKLKAALRGLAGAELAALRGRGVATEEESEEDWLSYCGDTGPGVFASEPRLFGSRILLVECTYLAPEYAERALRYGHLQLDDLVEVHERLTCEALVLHHLSRRHALSDLVAAAAARLPALAGRVHVLGADV